GDRSVFLWDVTTGSTIRRISVHLTKINVVEFIGGASSRSISFQNRQPIQALEEARDSAQTPHVGSSRIMSGPVDGHGRTYDLGKGELRTDYIRRTSTHVA
ncbi:hypothetical protein BJV78DRAFT_1136771, partial [Lactifluus subvellereus]